MSSPGNDQRRPAGNGNGIEKVGQTNTPSLAQECANTTRTREIVSRVNNAYAVVVIGKAARRHVFFGLPAAQKAVDRAHARGDFADLVLVKLTPVGELS